MPFYEVTYETGRTSVADYKDDAEAQLALKAHNDRAKNGLAGGPTESHPQGAGGIPNWPAERIAKVRVYTKHPNEFNPLQVMSAEAVSEEIKIQIERLADENGIVPVDALAAAVRGISHPMVEVRESAQDSVYKMKEDYEMALGFLDEETEE